MTLTMMMLTMMTLAHLFARLLAGGDDVDDGAIDDEHIDCSDEDCVDDGHGACGGRVLLTGKSVPSRLTLWPWRNMRHQQPDGGNL